MSPNPWQRLRKAPVVGRIAYWGMGEHAVSKRTKNAGARIEGLKATESVCPYCAVGCGQVVYTRACRCRGRGVRQSIGRVWPEHRAPSRC